MSMLEDLFLEDEAGEAQELERVLEGGGDYYDDERPGSPNSDNNEEGEDEAEEDRRRVDPTQAKVKRVIKNPRFVLNPARLTGPRGIQVIPDHYKDFKFKGKGHEKEDLDMVLKKLEHWAYRLYPKFAFHDCLKKIETLGKKRGVMVHLKQIRSDQFVSAETVVQKDSSDDEAPPPEDEFDKLLQQQIELARATPAPGSVKKTPFSTPSVDRSHIMPKATSSPSISDEQRERMLRNRQLAEERRLAKLRNETSCTTPKLINDEVINKDPFVELSANVGVRKHNRSNVIDSSDDEEVIINNESIVVDVDVHKKQDNGANDVENKELDRNKEQINDDEVVQDINVPQNDFHKLVEESDSKKDGENIIINHAEINDVMIENATESDNIHGVDRAGSISQTVHDKNGNDFNKTENVSPGHVRNITHNEELVDFDNKTSNDNIDSNVNDTPGDKSINNSAKEIVDGNIDQDVMDVDFSD